MTLVAGVSMGGMPAFVGDLLLSWRIPSPVELPTNRSEQLLAGSGGDYAAGLAQKLVIVRPYMMLAWAGIRSEAFRLLSELDAILPERAEDFHNGEAALEALGTCAAGTELVALFGTSEAVYPFAAHTRGFELNSRKIYLLGSGAANFFKYLSDHPDLLPGQENIDGIAAQGAMLRFASQSFAFQFVGGKGFDESWGGGFEVAHPTRQGFRKINNVLYRVWLLEDGQLKSSGRAFFSRYYGEDLYLNCIEEHQQTYLVPSPVGRGTEPPIQETVHPEWTLDSFIIGSTGAMIDTARYQPIHRPVRDTFHFRRGQLSGWNMDREYVEKCAAAALDVKGPNNIFHIQRY